MTEPLVIDLSPLLEGARGDAIAVGSVRVGDDAARLRELSITSADAKTGDERRTYRDGRIFRHVDGREVEIPLAELIDAAIAEGGWIRSGSIAFRVESGVVHRIFVRGPSLASLFIDDIAQIEARFGRAAGIDRRLGTVTHHYPERALVVSWDDRDGVLDHVALGPDVFVERSRGARDLLTELLSHWAALEAHDFREPGEGAIRVRYQRVAALARALGIGSVGDVVRGAFVEERGPSVYAELLEEIARRGPAEPTAGRPRSAQARWVYQHLLSYRRDAERVLSATRGWLECSDPSLLGMIASQNAIAATLASALAPIDDWLVRFVDPEGRTFGTRELIEHHGWPDVDVEALEMEEL